MAHFNDVSLNMRFKSGSVRMSWNSDRPTIFIILITEMHNKANNQQIVQHQTRKNTFFLHLFSFLPLWEQHLFEMKRIDSTCSSTRPQSLLQMNLTILLLFPTMHHFQNQQYMNSERRFVCFCRTKVRDIPNQLESWAHLFCSKKLKKIK